MATDYSKYNQSQYDNQKLYLENLISAGGGNGVWAQQELNSLNSQYKPSNSQATTPTQQKNSNQTTSHQAASNSNAFISPGSQVANDGTRYHSWGENNQYKSKDYVSGNADLQYALEQYMKKQGNNTYDVAGYVSDLYNRVGTNRNDGSVVTLADVDKELNRLGLGDYTSQNAIYTAGGTILPNNQYVTYKDGNQGASSNSEDSRWATYGGRDYLIGGDSANFVNYVNGKTGNLSNAALIFGDMANNPYAMQDPEFLAGYNQYLNNFNNTAGIGNNLTGNANVDNVINYVNSLNNYNTATGGNAGTTSLLDMLQSYLNGGLEANQEFLAQQKALAEQQAQQQASNAYVNKILAGDAMQEQLAAMGLGTSGALQSAMLGVQNDYSNNLANIQSNLTQMLNGLSEQELQILSDYYNNMANYAYQVTNDEADRAYRNAQLALQQQQMQYDEAYRQQQLALQMQQAEYERQMQQASRNSSNGNYTPTGYTTTQVETNPSDVYNQLISGNTTGNIGVPTGALALVQAQSGLNGTRGNVSYLDSLNNQYTPAMVENFVQNSLTDMEVANALIQAMAQAQINQNTANVYNPNALASSMANQSMAIYDELMKKYR